MEQKEKITLDFINEAADSMQGFEDINSATMSIPFIKLAQDMTPQVKKVNPDYIPGLEPGMFFNNVTKEIYGTELNLIVLGYEHVYIEWLPDRGGFVGYHSEENAQRLAVDKSVFGKWKTVHGNELQEYYTYFVLLAGREMEGIHVLSLASTGIKVAKNWNRLMTTHVLPTAKGYVKAKPYYLVWKLKSVVAHKDSYTFFTLDVSHAGYINKEQYEVIAPERAALPDRKVDYQLLEAPKSENDVSGQDDKPF